jgi:8-amino-7-oxononanoate synthase
MNEAVNKFHFIKEELSRRKRNSRFRVLREFSPISEIEIDSAGKKMINFCSNDYLGLSKHPLLIKRAVEFTLRYGTGSTASRMICGTLDCFKKTEERLAELKGTESALILNSGYQANVSILPALADRESLILSDSLIHNSIIQGALLSRCSVIRFRHNDMEHLRRLLEENYNKEFSRIFIVSESVFSVDGDRCDIDCLISLSEEFNAFLIIDEAHATGVLGKKGMGLSCGKNIDLVIGTFGKACGSFGAYVACSKLIRDYLINRCTGFVYSTAIPPSIVGSIDAALELIPKMENERSDLMNKAEFLRSSLVSLGLYTGNSNSQIIPVIMKKEESSLFAAEQLEKSNILVIAIRPPTVPEGESRIRLAVSSEHDWSHLNQVIRAFGEVV